MIKSLITTFCLFLLGTVIGNAIAPAVLQWLAAPFGASLVVMDITGPLMVKVNFAFGCGVLFAAAPITVFWVARLTRPALFGLLYLCLGCLISSAVAALYHSSYISLAADLKQSSMPAMVTLDRLATLQIPLLGAVFILCLGVFQRFVLHPAKRP